MALNVEDEMMESDDDNSVAETNNECKNEGNSGLADALAKVIRMSKSKKGKSIILSKAKLYCPNQETEKKTYDFEIESNKSIKKEPQEEEVVKSNIEKVKETKLRKKLVLKKQEKLHRGRLKPSALDREKERPLIKIATKGVVQLFNAVRQQQTKIKNEINKPGVTEARKEKILKSVDKNTFLEVLKGKHKLQSNLKESDELCDMKEEPENEEPSWQVLRDDFMMGAKLKDWDKNEEEVNE